MRVMTTDDDREHIARDADELVSMLNNNSYKPADSDQAWMSQTAERVQMLTGQTPRTTTPAAFIEDLIKLGILKQLDVDEQDS